MMRKDRPLSDVELRNVITAAMVEYYNADYAKVRADCIDDLLSLINTQKRLYAESEEKVITCNPQWLDEEPAWLCLLLRGTEVLAERVYKQSQLSSAYYQATSNYASPVIRVGETEIAANYLLRKLLEKDGRDD